MCYGVCEVNNEYASGKCMGYIHGKLPCDMDADERDRLEDEADLYADHKHEEQKDREMEMERRNKP